MKTLFIAVVVLSFTSVCWSAPLACNDLVKELDKGPDLSGRWYLIAMSLDSCLLSSLLKFAYPSLIMDYTLMEAPNVYHMSFSVKVYSVCRNESQTILHNNNRLIKVYESPQETSEADSLLQTSCPDCLVAKTSDSINALFFFSRRQNVNENELNEFVKQAECLKSSGPVVLNTDHDYENCNYMQHTNEEPDPAMQALYYQRRGEFVDALINCIKAYFMSLYQSIANMWS